MSSSSKKPGKQTVEKANTGFLLGHSRFAKICAVEGKALTPEMKKRLEEFEEQRLTAAQKRAAVLNIYRKKV